MTIVTSPRLVAITGLLLTISLAGCGGTKTVTVNGSVTRNGEALKVEKTTLVTITFALAAQAEKKEGQTYTAKYDHEQGTYSVTVPAGQYKAGVIVAPGKGKPPLIVPQTASKTYDLQSDQKIDLELGK